MTIDPRVSFWLSIALAALAYISGAASVLTDTGLDPVTVKHFLAWATFTLGLGSSINAVLAAIPSKSTPEAQKAFYLGPGPKPQP